MAPNREIAIQYVQAGIDKQRENEDEAERQAIAKYGLPDPKYNNIGRWTSRHSNYAQEDLDGYVQGQGKGTIDELSEGELVDIEFA